MAKKTRAEYREQARDIVKYFACYIDIPKNASVHAGKRVNINGDEVTGKWVDARVFVEEC